MYRFTCTEQNAPVRLRFAEHSSSVGRRYRSCFMSVFRCLEFQVRLLHFGKICGPLFVPNFMWLAWKICLIFAVRSKTEFRFSPAAIIFCVARNNLLHKSYTFFRRYMTTQNFRALYYVALLSLPPQKFALPSCWRS